MLDMEKDKEASKFPTETDSCLRIDFVDGCVVKTILESNDSVEQLNSCLEEKYMQVPKISAIHSKKEQLNSKSLVKLECVI